MISYVVPYTWEVLMSKKDKLIKKLRNQPNGMSPEEMEQIFVYIGYEFRNQVGSHKHFVRIVNGRQHRFDLLMNKNPVKRYLVDDLLEIIEGE